MAGEYIVGSYTKLLKVLATHKKTGQPQKKLSSHKVSRAHPYSHEASFD